MHDMMMLQGLSIAPSARAWLTAADTPKVLQVFDPACNLIDAKGKVFSLVLPVIGAQPFALVVMPQDDSELQPFSFSEFVDAEAAVSLEMDQLLVGPLVVDTRPAVVWSPSPPWRDIPPQALGKAAELVGTLLAREAPGDSLAVKLSDRLDRPVYERAALGWWALGRGILASDESLCRTGAAQLAGLGTGLTPAGDDFLIGVLYGLWASRPAVEVVCIAKVIVETAAARTTRLSAAWLQAAGAGEAGEAWHRLWQAVIASDEQQTLAASRLILRSGETSGADTLAGLVAILGLRDSRE